MILFIQSAGLRRFNIRTSSLSGKVDHAVSRSSDTWFIILQPVFRSYPNFQTCHICVFIFNSSSYGKYKEHI